MAVLTVPAIVGCLSLYIFYRFILFPGFVSPLAKIPNAHPSSPYVPFWILWQRYKERGNRATHKAHQKYGEIVRLGPNEISINCVDGGIKTVYGGGFEKHDWYPRQFSCYGKEPMFAMVHSKPHAARKRLLSNIYSKSTLQSSPQLAANAKTLVSTRFLPHLEEAARKQTPVEVWSMNNGITMDSITSYQFGLASSTQWARDHETRDRLVQMWTSRKPFEFHNSEVPYLVQFLEKFGFRIIPGYVDEANDAFDELNLEMCDKADQYLGEVDSPNEPVVYKQLKTGMARSNEKSTDGEVGVGIKPMTSADTRLEIAAEMSDHLGAGHETSAICLTYLYWQMCKHPEWQTKLRNELRSLSPSLQWPPSSSKDFDLPSPKSIDELPILNAILMETLRLHASIPGIEPRVTPAKPCTLAGYVLPPNVRVQAQPYSLHRNPEVFPDPESWSPSRWLTSDTKAMRDWFWAFGSGGRMCIGSNFALQSMKLLIASLYTNYSTSIFNDDGIEELDAYTTRPVSSKLVLNFTHV